ARLFGTHSMLSEYRNHSLVDRQRFRRKVQFEIGIGNLMLCENCLNREAQRHVTLSRTLEIIERAIVATLQECKQTDIAFDPSKRHRLSGGFGLLQRLIKKFFGGFELMQECVSIGQTIIDGRKLFLIVERRKTLPRGVLKYFRIVITIAAKVQVTDVVLDLAGSQKVFVGKENFARAQTTLDRFFIAPQHGKRDQLTDLGRSRSMNLADAEKASFRLFELGNRGLHFSVDESPEAGGPRG